MNKKSKDRIVPKLRFPEYQNLDGWEESRLGKVASFLKGKGISKSDITQNGALPCIRYGELYTQYKEIINNVKSFTDISSTDLILSQANDVIIPASGETKEDIASASCVLISGIALGGDLNIIRSKINGVFLSYYLNSAKKHEISQLAQGYSVVHLYSEQLKKLNIVVPKELSEQQKIADCLTSIDELITDHIQKLDALKEHKKGLMQQLFPAEGETVPRLRFKEFLNRKKWEEKNLGSICSDISSGKDRSDSGGKYNLFGSTGIIGKTSSSSHKGNYILVARVGANAGLLNRVTGEFGVTDNTLVIYLNASENLNFIYYSLDSISLNKLVFGSGQPLITGSQLKNLFINMPQPDEQQKIADCLSFLDELIKAQNQKVETLKAHKNGLMQGLFPKIFE